MGGAGKDAPIKQPLRGAQQPGNLVLVGEAIH